MTYEINKIYVETEFKIGRLTQIFSPNEYIAFSSLCYGATQIGVPKQEI